MFTRPCIFLTLRTCLLEGKWQRAIAARPRALRDAKRVAAPTVVMVVYVKTTTSEVIFAREERARCGGGGLCALGAQELNAL
jgi:hypothetical protein